ncbi:hypothetical protein N9L92_04480 [Saprospiraceae bacterium]|nr:hypothetical protein [Saprospiraceae bacterium]
MGTILLEIIKYTLPSLIVFATSYYILKQYIDSQYNMKAMEAKSKYRKDAIPLKLAAYERLLLLCDRIHLPNLILRLNDRGMNAMELKNAMIISIQQEYEHNLAQQLYTSQQLWDIITLAKNDLMSIVTNVSQQYTDSDKSNDLAHAIIKEYGGLEKNPLKFAIGAIKEEAKIILNV